MPKKKPDEKPSGLPPKNKGYKGGDPNYKPSTEEKDYSSHNFIIPPNMRA